MVAVRMKAERDSALERNHLVLSSNRETVKAHDERKDKTVNTLTKLRPLYKDGLTVAASGQVAGVVELRRRVTELGGKLEEKERQL